MPASASDLSVAKFARRLLRLERDFKTFQVTPRLGNSSIDDGGAIVVNDPSTGQPQVIIGDQGDGTNMVQQVSGPTPPKPSAPLIEAGIAVVYVTWDGRYADDVSDPNLGSFLVPTPMDFSRVEVHASTTPNFTPDFATTLQTTIESARGGRVLVGVPYGEPHYFRLVVRSLSGKGSIPSVAVAGESRKVKTPDVDESFKVEGGNIADFALAVTKFRSLQHQIY